MTEAALSLVNPDAERAVLGALMVTDALAGVRGETGLEPEHFWTERLRHVYRAIVALGERDQAIDAVTVVNELKAIGALDKAGGADEVTYLASTVPVAGNAIHYARIVVELAQWRARLRAAQMIQEAAANQDREKLADARSMLDTDQVAADNFYDAERQRELLAELIEPRKEPAFLWPMDKFNIASPLDRQQVIILSGYTGDGKSHFADQILDLNFERGFKVCLYDNEFAAQARAARRAHRLRGIPSKKARRRNLSDAEKRKLLEHINEDPIWPIVDCSTMSAEEVAADIRYRRWDLVVVDILHNFAFEDERDLGSIMRTFKRAAMAAKCCLILAAHINRQGVESGRRRRPVRSDLKWSNDVENLADIVAFVYRDQDAQTLEQLDTGYVYTDKVREGETATQRARLHKPRLRWEPYGEDDPSAPEYDDALALGVAE